MSDNVIRHLSEWLAMECVITFPPYEPGILQKAAIVLYFTVGELLMMKKIKNTIYVGAFIFGMVTTANATPVPFGSNHYEFIEVTNPLVGNNNSWAAADAAAAASTFSSINGHLATITSQEENDFLFGLVSGTFSGFNGAWLGGRDTQGWLAGPESGQNFSYTNWGGSEPNNAGFAYMSIGTFFAGINPGQWVDDSGVQGVPLLE